jgi:hypothetical protein
VREYESDYAETAAKMVRQLLKYAPGEEQAVWVKGRCLIHTAWPTLRNGSNNRSGVSGGDYFCAPFTYSSGNCSRSLSTFGRS